jgi:DNA processing protein
MAVMDAVMLKTSIEEMNTEINTAILALSSIKGIGPAFFKKNFDKIRVLRNQSGLEVCLELLDLAKKAVDRSEIADSLEKAASRIVDWKGEAYNFCTFLDADYPERLVEIKDPPPFLFYLGDMSCAAKSVAVIGTREPSRVGKIIAERVGAHFAEQGYSICNGIVDGIDAASIQNEFGFHRRTIGILSGGLDFSGKRTVSKTVQANAERILEKNGLLISEELPHAKENSYTIIGSCRIQSGISLGTILIESSVKGGSRFAPAAVAELSRPIGVIVPRVQDLDEPNFGANRLLYEKREKGLAEFIDASPSRPIKARIIPIANAEDYSTFETEMNRVQPGSENLGTFF